MTTRLSSTPARAAPARQVEVVVVGVIEGGQHYTYGLLVSQVHSLRITRIATTRPATESGKPRPVAELVDEDEVLPIYDLAAVLHQLAAWKVGTMTTVRSYLLVVRNAAGGRYALAVDTVAEIGLCDIADLYPVPPWLRRQLRPSLVWAGVRRDRLTFGPGPVAGGPPTGLPAASSQLLLLLDCAALPLGWDGDAAVVAG